MWRSIPLLLLGVLRVEGQLTCTQQFACSTWKITQVREPQKGQSGKSPAAKACTGAVCEYQVCFAPFYNKKACNLPCTSQMQYTCGGTTGNTCASSTLQKVNKVQNGQWTCAWGAGGQVVTFVAKDSLLTCTGTSVTSFYPFAPKSPTPKYDFSGVPVACSVDGGSVCGGGGCVLQVTLPPCSAVNTTTAPPPPANVCVDNPVNWTDQEGRRCETYVNQSLCTPTGNQGPQWDTRCGNLKDYKKSPPCKKSPNAKSPNSCPPATSALDACCGCGGGVMTSCSAAAWSSWSACSVTCGVGTQSRSRTVSSGTCASTDSRACNTNSTKSFCLCTDDGTWKDIQGKRCVDYYNNKWCYSNMTYGPNWASQVGGTFASKANAAGLDATEACCGCGAACVSDVMLLLDRSGSIGAKSFALVVQYVTDRINMTRMNTFYSWGNRIGVAVFSTNVQILCPLTNNQQQLLDCVSTMSYPGGYTAMGDGIAIAFQHLTANSNSSRTRYLEILTDGVPNLPTGVNATQYALTQATAVKAAGIIITAIGVGPDTTPAVLQALASTPLDQRYTRLGDWSALPVLAQALTAQCQPALDATLDPYELPDGVNNATPRCQSMVTACSWACGSGVAVQYVQSISGALCYTGNVTIICNDTNTAMSNPCVADQMDGWLDSRNYSCLDYVTNQWCNPDGTPGPNWDASYTFADFAMYNLTCRTACAGCGLYQSKQDTIIVVDLTTMNWNDVKSYLLERLMQLPDPSDGRGNHIGIVGATGTAASVLCGFTFDRTYLRGCVQRLFPTYIPAGPYANLTAGLYLAAGILNVYSSPLRCEIIEVLCDKVPPSPMNSSAIAAAVDISTNMNITMLPIGIGVDPTCTPGAVGCGLFDFVYALAVLNLPATIPSYANIVALADVVNAGYQCGVQDDVMSIPQGSGGQCPAASDLAASGRLRKNFCACSPDYITSILQEYSCVVDYSCYMINCQHFIPDAVFGQLSQCVQQMS